MLKFGLIGEKLSHSISPQIHADIFREAAIEGEYKLYEIERENLPEIKRFIVDNQLSGINVTIPYKQEIMPFLDEISSEARQIGAVNTVLINDGRLFGFNTDYFGFGEMLRFHSITFKNKPVVVLGNGGAAKAVATYLSNNGASQVYIASRKPSEEPSVISYDEILTLDDYLLVNTTPVGMFPNDGQSPVLDDVVKKSYAVVDLIYNPRATCLMEQAKAFNKPSCNGMYMLVSQAVKAEEIWHNTSFSDTLSTKIYEAKNRG